MLGSCGGGGGRGGGGWPGVDGRAGGGPWTSGYVPGGSVAGARALITRLDSITPSRSPTHTSPASHLLLMC